MHLSGWLLPLWYININPPVHHQKLLPVITSKMDYGKFRFSPPLIFLYFSYHFISYMVAFLHIEKNWHTTNTQTPVLFNKKKKLPPFSFATPNYTPTTKLHASTFYFEQGDYF